MYIPKANEEKRVPVIHELMRAHPMASLVTMSANGLIASHIPMELEEDGSEFGVLRGHVSRANPQWRDVAQGVDALAIFSGPQHYISASWYPGKLEDGREVPTWNYAVAHAYGSLRVVESAVWMLKHLNRLTDIHEAGSREPWSVGDAPVDFIETMMRGIVGLELPITRLEGKWKVSQNRTEEDKDAVVAELERMGTKESLLMKGMIEGRR